MLMVSDVKKMGKELEEISPGALVWSGGTGHKVIIVIDDNYKDASIANPRSAWGKGLYTLWRELGEWEETQAIGFFYLPQRKSELRDTIKQVIAWIEAFDVECSYYIVLDVFSGDIKFPIGLNLAELLSKSRNRKLRKARLTFFSLAGWTEDLARQKFKEFTVFEKSDFKQKIPVDFWEWLDRSFGLEKRIWQAGTEDWFKTDRRVTYDIVPHNWTPLKDNTEWRNACREVFRKYLTKLLSFEPPEEWLSDRQFEYLFEDLKYLVGSCCRAHFREDAKNGNRINSDRNLTLGNVILLLAAATSDYSSSWISSIEWNRHCIGRQILPSGQTWEQARAAILSLADNLFPSLAQHDDTREPLIDSVKLTERLLSIKLKFNCTISTKGDRPSLLEKVQTLTNNYGGQVYSAYKQFLVMSALSRNARDARCVINLRASNNNQDFSILEIQDVHKCSCS